jgi:hypothetical protein
LWALSFAAVTSNACTLGNVNTSVITLGPGAYPVESSTQFAPATTSHLLRCLLLAALLHVWLVLLLGTAPGGTAQRGQGVWGAINISLRGPQTPGATADSTPPEPLPPSGPAGTAINPRFGGVVREAGPAPAPEPGAAQLGNWTATPLPISRDSSLPAAASPTPRVDAAQASSGPPPTQGRVTEPRATELPATPPGPIPVPAPPPVPMAAAEPAPTPLAERSLSPTIERDRTRPTDVPALISNPVDANTLRARSLPSRLPELAAAVPALAPPTVAAPAPPAPPVAAPSPTTTTAAPTVAAPVVEAPPALRAITGPAADAPQPAAAPLQSDAASVAAPGAPTFQSPVLAGPAIAAPAPQTAAPNAGPRVGTDVPTPASPATSAPRLNLQLARPRGGELSQGGATGVLQLLPRPPELPSKLAKEIEKTGKPNCKDAYAGGGLLAVVPLVLDAVRQEGCKW